MNELNAQKEINKQDEREMNWWKTKWNYIMMFVFSVSGTVLFALIDATLGGFMAAGFGVAGWYVGNPIGNKAQKDNLYRGANRLARELNMNLSQFAISTLTIKQLNVIKKSSDTTLASYVNDLFYDGYINIYQRYVLETRHINDDYIDKRIKELRKKGAVPDKVVNIQDNNASLENVLSAFDQDDGVKQNSETKTEAVIVEKTKSKPKSFFSSQLARSMQKTKIMEEAIAAELKIYEQIQMYSEHKHIDHETSKRNFENQKYAREKLYNFLSSDEILSSEFSKYSFEGFSNAIDCLRAMGLTFSKNEDYIPIAAFCFKTPLSITIEGFIEEKIDLGTAMVRLLEYFNEE